MKEHGEQVMASDATHSIIQKKKKKKQDYYAFDSSKIQKIYRIVGRRYGRTNNELISILHAIDKGFDETGDAN
jgi:hypothetical protein